jgi:hypothetical protein
MKKVITILLVILVLAAGVGFGVYHHKSNETKFNDDYINGNTAGNLYNAGIFCTAADGTIYFANPSDGSKLYSVMVQTLQRFLMMLPPLSIRMTIIFTMCATIRFLQNHFHF